MELMRSRSVPENLRQLANIIWPEVPVTDIRIDQARTHPINQREIPHETEVPFIETKSQTTQLVSPNISAGQKLISHSSESAAIKSSSKTSSTLSIVRVSHDGVSRNPVSAQTIIKDTCPQDTILVCEPEPASYRQITNLPLELQKARVGKQPIAPDENMNANQPYGTDHSENDLEDNIEASNVTIQQFDQRDGQPIHSTEGKESRSKAIQRRLLGRFAIRHPPWPDPQLSLGTRCNRLAGNECWEAIGPARELFSSIAQPIADLLNTRGDELDEDEPVADNVLTFSMYMVGKDSSLARPTLLFICPSSKPRKRAIKFLKESMILNPYPKIKLADSPACPLAIGSNRLRLLASEAGCSKIRGTTTATCHNVFKRQAQPAPDSVSHGISQAAAGGMIGVAAALLALVLLILFLVLGGREKIVCIVSSIKRSAHGRKRGRRLRWMPSQRHWSLTRQHPIDLEAVSLNPVFHELAGSVPQWSPEIMFPVPLEDSNVYVNSETQTPVVFPDAEEHGLDILKSHAVEQSGSDYSSSHHSSAWSYERHGRVWSDSSDQSDPSLSSCRGATELGAKSEEQRRVGYESPPIPDSNQGTKRLEVAGVSLMAINEVNEYGLSNSELREMVLTDARSSREASRNEGFASQSLSRQPDLPKRRDSDEFFTLDMLNRDPSSVINVEVSAGRPVVVLHSGQQGNCALNGGYTTYPHNDCGFPVFCLSTGRRATIGGIVCSKGVMYGMTVAHVFELSTQNSTDEGCIRSGILSEDLEFTFDEDDEDDQVDENGAISDVAITSHASMSSVASRSLSLSNSMSTRSFLSRSGSSKAHSSFGAIIPTIQEGEASELTGSPLDEFGQLAATSMLKEDLGLDWALVELSTTTTDSLMFYGTLVNQDSQKPYPTTQAVAPQLLKDTTILVLKGTNEISRGTISPSTTMMKFSGRSQFQEVWVARLDTPSLEGDSGAWVIDAENGDLYGHIVAGIPGEKFAYVVPATRVFADIGNTLGRPIQFRSADQSRTRVKTLGDERCT